MSEDISQMIEDCENRSEKLSDWETKFIDSLSHQVAKGKEVTPKQLDRLELIWNRVTD